MQGSKAVQLSRTGVTHVAFPANAETFVSRAASGTGDVRVRLVSPTCEPGLSQKPA
jgi:hypothetical protein